MTKEKKFIDWRSKIPNEFLYPNKSHFKRFNKETPKTIEGLKDNQLLIRLGGIKYLARLRGFSKCNFQVLDNKLDIDNPYCVVKCSMIFTPNSESEVPVEYEEVASVHRNNCDDFSLNFVESIAANRAFVRCVRGFLNINIVGDDEIDKTVRDEFTSADSSIQGVLKKTLEEKRGVVSYEDFMKFSKSFCAKGEIEEIASKGSFKKLSPKLCRSILGGL